MMLKYFTCKSIEATSFELPVPALHSYRPASLWVASGIVSRASLRLPGNGILCALYGNGYDKRISIDNSIKSHKFNSILSPDCLIVTNVVAHIDYKVKQLHNQNKCFVQTIHERHHLVQICTHQHVVVVVVDMLAVVDTDNCNCIVFVDHIEVVVVLEDIWCLNLQHTPKVHISRSIHLVKQLQQNPCHNLEHYKFDDHNSDLIIDKKQ